MVTPRQCGTISITDDLELETCRLVCFVSDLINGLLHAVHEIYISVAIAH